MEIGLSVSRIKPKEGTILRRYAVAALRRVGFAVSLMTLLLLSAVAGRAQESVNAEQLRLVEMARGFAKPLFITHAGDGSGRLFVVEQGGRIWVLRDGVRLPQPFLDISNTLPWEVHTGGYTERGLLGLAFHPDFAKNGFFFLHYNNTAGDTVLARWRVSAEDPNRADPRSAQIIFTLDQPFANHQGGMLAFGPDGYLYFGLGDGGSANDPWGHGQRRETLLGTILRLDVGLGEPADYRIPPDNPFVGQVAPEIWAYGLRNPWRFSFDRLTGDLYIGDVGQNQWEEINFQPANSVGGENYGWKAYEGYMRFAGGVSLEETAPPIAVYPHSLGNSVTGGYVYRGARLPALFGSYLFGDFGSGRIWRSQQTPAGGWQTAEFLQTTLAISSFGEDEMGELYLLDYRSGSVWKFLPRG